MPMQATLRRPLWVLRGSFLVCHREVTPVNNKTSQSRSLVQLTQAHHSTFESILLGDSSAVNHFIPRENLANWDLFLHVFPDSLHLISNRATIHLNLHQVSFLLTQTRVFLGGGGGHSPPLEDFVPPLEHLK